MKAEFKTTVGQIAEWSGGILLKGDAGSKINTISSDSRELGPDCLFIPLRGEKYDGHQFIDGLARGKRIAAFLTMNNETMEYPGVSIMQCDDTLKALGKIASGYRSSMKTGIIGITGTNGKTTTKEMIYSILSRKFKTLKNEKNYNNEIGVPFTLLGLRESHGWAVIEMGMNHKGEIDALSGMAMPDIALITNIGEGHLEFLGSIENVAEAKSEIMHGMKPGSLIILNRDTRCFDDLRENADSINLKVKTFGLSDNADVKPASYKMKSDSIRFEYNGNEYEVPLYGIHNIYNSLAAISVSESVGIEGSVIKDALVNFKNIDMRSQIIEREFIIINDTYNSNPLSARYALNSLRETFSGKRKIAILSDMKELGDSSEYYHTDLGREAFSSGVDTLLTWGDMAENITMGARKSGMKNEKAMHFKSKNELISFAKKNLHKNDVVLIKGSRSMKMEEVVEAIIH